MNDARLTDDALAGMIQQGFGRYELPITALPVRPRPRAGRRFAPLLALPVAALVIALVATQAARPPSAFASWSAVPTTVDPAFQSALLGACADPVGPDTDERDRAFMTEVNALPMVLVDQRGTSGIALFAERRATGIASKLCLGSQDASGTLRTAGSGASLGGQEVPATGDLRLVERLTIWSYGGETLTAAMGTSGTAVAKVVVSRASGGDVTATVKDGYWVAWWPGEVAAEGVAAFAADGSSITAIAP